MNTKSPQHVCGFLVLTGSRLGIEGEPGHPASRRGRARADCEEIFVTTKIRVVDSRICRVRPQFQFQATTRAERATLALALKKG